MIDAISNESSTNSLFSMKPMRTTSSLDMSLHDEMGSGSYLSLASLRNSIREKEMEERSRDKFIVILVGLPASGKSTISSHMIQSLKNDATTSYLRSTVYNAGKMRRMLCNGQKKSLELAKDPSEDLFNPANADRKEVYARITLENLIQELDSDICDFAIFDATNSTVERRSFVFKEIYTYNEKPGAKYNLNPIVLQVTCSEEDFVRYNIHNKTFNEDYFDKPYEVAVQDFSKRLKYYHSQFVPFTHKEFDDILEANTNCARGKPTLYYYNVINAGLVNTESLNKSHVRNNTTQSPIVRNTLDVIENFIENYASQYGFSYINRVRQFFDDSVKGLPQIAQNSAMITASFIPSKLSIWEQSNKLRHTTLLKKIVNKDYFSDLSSYSKKFNEMAF
ncbi:6-phosphofructo-2-kinase 2 [Nakaseomyces bracarensis]|uniref:6-phosphofructo-2-kinase 2 n=1 Tax=Nakaseomyces bracarensis TaxID=273131 RepID=A0ABR4NT58_9SACH